MRQDIIEYLQKEIKEGWLHDAVSITDYNLYEEHHIHGAEMTKEILE